MKRWRWQYVYAFNILLFLQYFIAYYIFNFPWILCIVFFKIFLDSFMGSSELSTSTLKCCAKLLHKIGYSRSYKTLGKWNLDLQKNNLKMTMQHHLLVHRFFFCFTIFPKIRNKNNAAQKSCLILQLITYYYTIDSHKIFIAIFSIIFLLHSWWGLSSQWLELSPRFSRICFSFRTYKCYKTVFCRKFAIFSRTTYHLWRICIWAVGWQINWTYFGVLLTR